MLSRAISFLPLVVLAGWLAGCGTSSTSTLNSAGSDHVTGAVPASIGSNSETADRRQLAKAASAVTAVATPGNAAYLIGPQDVLEVSVFKVPDLSRTVQVADSGTVNVPLLGEVQAVGRTAQEIERDLEQGYGAKYLRAPQVTVFVKEYNSQRITVEGEVKKPGVYPIRGRTSLMQSVATAGGLTELANTTDIVVFREKNGKRSAARFDLDEIRSGKSPDPGLAQGDVVVVSMSQSKQTYQNIIKALPALGAFVPFL